jgi:predicted transcriptional regulator
MAARLSDIALASLKRARESFRDEAARAWQDYKHSGRYFTQAEVDAWVESLDDRKPKR